MFARSDKPSRWMAEALRLAVAIPEVKRLIRSLDLEDIRRLRQDVLASLETGQARKTVERFRRKHMKRAALGS